MGKKEDDAKYYITHREEQKKYKREYYLKNKKSQVERQRRKNKILRDWYYKNIAELSCDNCNLFFGWLPGIAEFHHVERSVNNVAILVALYSGYNKFCMECKKGVFLCPTCHKIGHVFRGDQHEIQN